MAILGILFVLLLKTYNWIATVVFRVQQEKEVTQEMLQISQLIQNYSDRNTIDYPKYFEQSSGGLIDAQGITDVLYLSGQDGKISFFASGDCIDPAIEYAFTGVGSWCSLYMYNGSSSIELINTKKIVISKVLFKVIPFASEQQYLASSTLCQEWNYLHCINTPGFRMLFNAYSVNYWKQWSTHVKVPFQQFF